MGSSIRFNNPAPTFTFSLSNRKEFFCCNAEPYSALSTGLSKLLAFIGSTTIVYLPEATFFCPSFRSTRSKLSFRHPILPVCRKTEPIHTNKKMDAPLPRHAMPHRQKPKPGRLGLTFKTVARQAVGRTSPSPYEVPTDIMRLSLPKTSSAAARAMATLSSGLIVSKRLSNNCKSGFPPL